MMTEPTSYMNDLIVRFFTDDLTADERLELDNWKAESPDNRVYFEQLEEIWFSVADPNTTDRFHKERAYDDFLKRVAVAREAERPRERRWLNVLKYAAVAVVTVGLFSYLSYRPTGAVECLYRYPCRGSAGVNYQDAVARRHASMAQCRFKGELFAGLRRRKPRCETHG